MPELLNNSARVLSFLGGKVHGGFTLVPTVREQIAPEHVATIVGDEIQARVMRAHLDSGDVLDVHNAFADLPAGKPVRAPRAPQPKPARFDSTTSTPREEVHAIEVVPPAPTIAPRAAVQAVPDLPQFAEAIAHAAPMLENLGALAPSEALAAIAGEEVIETLGKWWQAETRPEIKSAIETRGFEIKNRK